MTDEAKKELIKALAKGNPELQINIDCNDVCFKKEMQQEPATQQKTAEEAEYCDYEEVCDEEATPQTVKNEPASDNVAEENNIILQLMPIFNDNEEYAKLFLATVRTLKPTEIVELVKKYRIQKRLDPQLCHHRLWKILYDNKLYSRTERNWNDLLKY